MSEFINKTLLFPYYLALKIRHRRYDSGKAESRTFDVPVISIGNVTVGGTGKTPHTEMFVKYFLQQGKRVAVVSRGYMRKSSSRVEVLEYDKASQTGDEPLQIKRKFPACRVIVDKKRESAIDSLIALPEGERPEVILLDDAFQYRKVNPSRSIVLIDYSRPIFKDSLLPLGMLRDLPRQISRADTVIVTKCPAFMNEWEKQKCREINRISPEQKLYFTTLQYAPALPVFSEDGNGRYVYAQEAVLVTGIANPDPLRLHLTTKYQTVYHLKFADHHRFNRHDIRRIARLARRHPRSVLLTTEKDAQRLRFDVAVPKQVRERMFYVPVEVIGVSGETSEGLFDLK